MTVKDIYQFDSGGIIYKDANGVILGTGTAQDSAAPDPENNNGIFIYCQSPARTLYAIANTPITYRVKFGLTVTTTPTRNQFLTILSENFFFRVTGGGPETQNLDDVLTIGNNAGANNIDMNGQDITNVDEIETKVIKTQLLSNLDIQADLDIIFNPGGIIDANGKTLNMRNGEIHAAHLIHGRNNTDFKVQAKGTGDLILETSNTERLKITDSGQFIGLPNVIQLAASDETTALTTGTAKVTFRMPHAMTLTAVRASLTTAQTSGAIFTVDINQNGNSILGTKITIDNTEKTSTTAATPATITTSALTDDAEITIDVDQIGDGTGKGLKITLIGTIQ
jgi:hypothetical protein